MILGASIISVSKANRIPALPHGDGSLVRGDRP